MNDRLSALRAAGVLSALDEHLARTLCSIAGESRESVRLAVALVSHQVARGHVCVSLPALVRGELPVANDPEVDPELLRWPALDDWSAALANSRLVGPADANTPLVFDAQQRLYLRKHFAHERDLGSELLRRIQAPELSVDGARLAEGLARLFPKQGPDLQRTAAELALRRPFSVISGGPGTGKTATVVKILALVIEQ
ncbi:MAG TPA: AAA family ATPase, partial [Polyangiales bacterium]|nr:AAA family ATPase [Polyangiales bacterium]